MGRRSAQKNKISATLKKYVIFIETQTGQKVRRPHMDQNKKFVVCKLEDFQAEKSIKIEYIIAYLIKMNGISKRTNCFIIVKTRYLFLDFNLP